MTDDRQEIVEDALSKRLAKLCAMPVDLSRLEARLRQEVPPVVSTKSAGANRWRIGWKTITSIAASLIFVATVAWVVFTPGQVQASPADLVRIHQELISGTGTMHVENVDQANKMIDAMAKGTVKVPKLPGMALCECCTQSIQNKPVACVLLENGSEPVTMTVAAASDMKCSGTGTVVAGGVTYHTQRAGELNMVMTHISGRWVCLVSKAKTEQLVAIARKLQF